MIIEQDNYYTYEEAAEVLGVAHGTVCMAVSKGVLHPIKQHGVNRKLLSKQEVESMKGKPLLSVDTIRDAKLRSVSNETIARQLIQVHKQLGELNTYLAAVASKMRIDYQSLQQEGHPCYGSR